MRQMLLQNATAVLLQNASGFLLQNATVLLQNATVIANCDDFNKKCDVYYNCDSTKLKSIFDLLKMSNFLLHHTTR